MAHGTTIWETPRHLPLGNPQTDHVIFPKPALLKDHYPAPMNNTAIRPIV